jgi:hypothetical protein
MNRRNFLRAAFGATVGVVAGTELVEALIPTRKIFLPPRDGWVGRANAGIPQFLTNYVDPQLIDYLIKPMSTVRIIGETDTQLRCRVLRNEREVRAFLGLTELEGYEADMAFEVNWK